MQVLYYWYCNKGLPHQLEVGQQILSREGDLTPKSLGSQVWESACREFQQLGRRGLTESLRPVWAT